MKEEKLRPNADDGRGGQLSPQPEGQELAKNGSILADIACYMDEIASYLEDENDREFSDRVALMLFRICVGKCNNEMLQQIVAIGKTPVARAPRYVITKGKLTDFVKIMKAMFDLHIFSTPDGMLVTSKQELFNYFAELFGVKLNNYSQLLNSAKQGSKDYSYVFRQMLEMATKFENE